MAGGHLAGHKSTAADLGAWLCWEDESGQGLRPPKGRTSGRRGHTPVVTVTGGHDTRVSLAALIAVRPDCRPRLIYRTHRARRGDTRKGFTETGYARLLDAARRQLNGPIVLVWDNLNTHASGAMAELIAARDRLTVFRLPPYASELNPVEPVWPDLKRSLANLAKHDIDELTALVKSRLGGCSTGPACSRASSPNPAWTSRPSAAARCYAGVMRYPDGGGLTAAEQALRAKVPCYKAPGTGRILCGAGAPRREERGRPGHELRARMSVRTAPRRVPVGARSRPLRLGRPRSSPLPSRPGRGGSCPRERRSCQASTTPYPKKPDAAITATIPKTKAGPARFSALVKATTPTRANAMSTHTPDLRAAFANVRAAALAGTGSVAADLAGISAVRAASSA